MAGFQKAKREQVWIKVLLSGASGSGKSFSALRVGTGIAKACGSKIAYIGTEGSRNKYYADDFDYDLLELESPFESEKYMKAIDAAVDAGYKVLIIDSTTHEWKWLNDVHDKMPGNSFTNWSKLKPRHAKFMEKVLTSPIHVIATARGKDEYVLEEKNGKQVPKKVGMGAQQDKDISYEYTVSLMISQDDHIASADKDNTKLFDGKYEVLTEKHGALLYEWANKGEAPAPKKQKPREDDKDDEYDDDYEDELNITIDKIIKICTKVGGTKNKKLMTTLKQFAKNGNPKAIKDIENAEECLEAVKKIKPIDDEDEDEDKED